jgi:hypothetical protein
VGESWALGDSGYTLGTMLLEPGRGVARVGLIDEWH